MIHPDLLVLNANIITVDNKNSTAEAMAIKGDRIVALGSTDELKDLVGSRTKVIDAAKRTVVPGFIDAHCHLLSITGRQMLDVNCSADRVRNIDDIVYALKNKTRSTARGQWILGSGYDHTKLKEQRHPSRWELDRVSIEHPIHLRHVSGHLGVVNSKGLAVAGFTRHTNDPAGGSFDRDSKGDLTGLCREEADFVFLPGIGGEQSIIPPPTAEQMLMGLEMACSQYNSFGITSAGDAAVSPAEIAAYQSALAAGKLTVRVYMIILDSYLSLLKQLRLHTGFGNEYLRIGSIKSFVDGAIAGGTAWLSEPYEGRAEDFGILTRSREALLETIFDAHAAGFQVSVHANGDRAITMVLDVLEEVLDRNPRKNHRHRIAHCTVVDQEILSRIKKLGVVVLPFSTYIYEHGDKMPQYGSRISRMFAYCSFLDFGIPVGGSSDHPCATQNPLVAIQTMATRLSSDGDVLGPDQRISVSEALRIYTIGSAYASFEEHLKGSLETGKLADFVILERDPNTTPLDSIREISVEKTYIGGKEVYSRT